MYSSLHALIACTTLVCTGSIGVLWFLLWLLLGFDSPATHPRISEKERKYIEASIQDYSFQQVR